MYLNSQSSCNLNGISYSERYSLKHCLSHIISCRVHTHPYKCSSHIRIIMRRALAHKIRQKEDIIFTKVLYVLLTTLIILRSKYLLKPPFIARCGTKHTAHEMIFTVGIRKGMKRVIVVHRKFIL